MDLFLEDRVWNRIERISKDSFPEEACGLLVGKWLDVRVVIEELREAENTFGSSKAFKIDPELVISVLGDLENKDEELVGFFHSHPNMSPYISSRDKKFMKLWLDKIWIIAGTNSNGKAREVKGYRSIGDEIKELKINRDQSTNSH